jgi:fucose 4-O-acetylase-like acetyltransferase
MSCGFNHAVPDLGIDRCPVMAVKLLTGGSLLGGIFGVFWFIPCLLGALILAQFVLGESGSRRLVAGIMLVGLAYTVPLLVPQSTAILALGAVPMACCLVLTGYALRKEIAGLNVPLLALCAALSLMVIAVGAPLDMKVADYGPPVLGMVGAVALSCLLIRLSSALTQWPKAARLLSWLGARSLTVLYLHQVVHLGLRHFGVNNEGILLVVALALPAVVHTSLHRLFDPAGQALLSLFSRKSPPSPVRLP